MLNNTFWRCLVSTRSMENRVANMLNGTTYNDHCIYTTITSISTDSTIIYSDIRLNRFTCANLSNLQELYDETLWIHVRSQFDDLKDCDMITLWLLIFSRASVDVSKCPPWAEISMRWACPTSQSDGCIHVGYPGGGFTTCVHSNSPLNSGKENRINRNS